MGKLETKIEQYSYWRIRTRSTKIIFTMEVGRFHSKINKDGKIEVDISGEAPQEGTEVHS